MPKAIAFAPSWPGYGARVRDGAVPILFSGWVEPLEHGRALETSQMRALHHLVELERAVDPPPAGFPPYDVYPSRPDWTPPSGTLSSLRQASKQKGE